MKNNFDLKQAILTPERVITNDGRGIDEIYLFSMANQEQNLFVVIEGQLERRFPNGKLFKSQDTRHDLNNLPEVIEGWLNVSYFNGECTVLQCGQVHPTKEMALQQPICSNSYYIKTIRITNQK